MPESTAPDPSRRRILIGTQEIVGQVHHLAEGFRALGHEVTAMVDRPNPYYPEHQYDVVLRPSGRGRRDPRDLAARTSAFLSSSRGHDTFLFVFGSTLLPRQLDIPLLARLRKDLLFLFLGSDIRHWEATAQFRASVGLSTYGAYRDRDPARQVKALRRAEVYGSVSFFQPSYAEAAIGPYMHAYLALDPSEYRFHVPDRSVPVVVHAPSRRSLKGTEEIVVALDSLRQEGVEFDLRLLENTPNHEVRRVLEHADVVVDELREAHYGMLALEGIASGCAVLAGNRTDLVPTPVPRPVVHLCPENLIEELRKMLSDRAHRTAVAESGRGFVERHHDRVGVAERMLHDLDRARAGDFDYHPTFFTRWYRPDLVRASLGERLLTRRSAQRWGIDAAARQSLRERHLSV